jgi:DNA-binding MarR family transcriptional regulator
MESAPASAATDGAYEGFWDALDEFVRALGRARGRAAASVPAGELTIPQYKLLEALTGREAPRIGELAASIEVAPPTATRMLAGLEREGLIVRRAVAEDRRAVEVELTERGRRARRRARARLESRRRRLFEALPERDRAVAARVLRELADGMDAL